MTCTTARKLRRPGARLRGAVIEALEGRTFLSVAPHAGGYVAEPLTTLPAALLPGGPGVSKLPIATDDSTAPVDLGSNTFRFYGQVYDGSMMFVSSNGLITFGSPVADSMNTSDLGLPVGTPPSPATIAPLWADWNANPRIAGPDAQVLQRFDDLNGDGKPDQLVIQWNAVGHSSLLFEVAPGRATFQAILSLNTPGNGNIVFNYIGLNTGEDDSTEGSDATVGIRAADPSPDPLNIAYNGNNSNVHSGKAILIHQANQAPVATDDAYATYQGTPLTIGAQGVLANDSDADGNTLSAVKPTQPAHGQVTLDSTGAFVYTPASGYSGPDSFQYVATDGLAESNPATVNITVKALPTVSVNPSAIDEGGTVTVAAQFSGVGAADAHTVMVDFGDGSAPVSASVDAATMTYFASHRYADDPGPIAATFPITATVRDADGSHGSAGAAATVRNVAPTISNLTTTVDPVAIGTGVATASAEFTDPGMLDTHMAFWDWGDGITTPATLAEPDLWHAGTVSDTHSYAAAGTYTVCLTVCDNDGGKQTLASKAFVVVYDPSAGFVTGGGWIDSPAGAYAVNPAAVGKGRFGFVSKYQKGTTIPTGQTQFTLNVASLSFHSTAYDWMVVSGPRADYHGTGTMNGLAGYHFQLTAIDGTAAADLTDRVRLRIWCDATGALVYDNGLGATGDNGPGTALAGGSVVVHA